MHGRGFDGREDDFARSYGNWYCKLLMLAAAYVEAIGRFNSICYNWQEAAFCGGRVSMEAMPIAVLLRSLDMIGNEIWSGIHGCRDN